MKKPKNYYCHRNSSEVQITPKGYEIIDKIGEGAFGQVYKVFNPSTSSIEVMKLNKGQSTSAMNKQTEIMMEMNSSDGFAKIKDTNTGDRFLIMSLLGDSLQTILQKNVVNLVDMKRIGYQCIARLKQLHDRGYVHRDLKPDNILLGNQNNPHKIYLVDFGLSSAYKKGGTVARKCYNGEIGTIKFCPLASHYCLEQYPKDDLESLGYLLIYISTKELAWSRLQKGLQQKEQFQYIKKKKQQTQIQKLSQGISCLRKYFKMVKEIKVGSVIDYARLLQIFYIPCQDYFCYSFCRINCFAKLKNLENNQKDQVDIEEDLIQDDHSLKKINCLTKR